MELNYNTMKTLKSKVIFVLNCNCSKELTVTARLERRHICIPHTVSLTCQSYSSSTEGIALLRAVQSAYTTDVVGLSAAVLDSRCEPFIRQSPALGNFGDKNVF